MSEQQVIAERWPGYDEQSWSERFAELDRRGDASVEQDIRNALILARQRNEAIAETDRLREALNAIIDRAPERDKKWIGMSSKDIALFALRAPGGEDPRHG